MEQNTLRHIAEDAFLTAAKIRTLDDDYLGVENELDSYRLAEIIVNLGERIIDQAGIPHEAVWVPDALRDMLDPDYLGRTTGDPPIGY
jgi:hypothetical protein